MPSHLALRVISTSLLSFIFTISWAVRKSYFLEPLEVVNSEYLVFHWLLEILIEKFRIPKFFGKFKILRRVHSPIFWVCFKIKSNFFNCLPKGLFTQSCLNHKYTFLDIWIYLSPKLKMETWYKWKCKYGIKDDGKYSTDRIRQRQLHGTQSIKS